MEELRKVSMREVRKRIQSLELTGFDRVYNSYYIQVNGLELTGIEREYLIYSLGCTEHQFRGPRKRRFYLPPGVKLVYPPFGG